MISTEYHQNIKTLQNIKITRFNRNIKVTRLTSIKKLPDSPEYKNDQNIKVTRLTRIYNFPELPEYINVARLARIYPSHLTYSRVFTVKFSVLLFLLTLWVL